MLLSDLVDRRSRQKVAEDREGRRFLGFASHGQDEQSGGTPPGASVGTGFGGGCLPPFGGHFTEACFTAGVGCDGLPAIPSAESRLRMKINAHAIENSLVSSERHRVPPCNLS